MSTQLADWPSVTDTFLEVDGRQVRILSAPGRGASDARPQLLVHGLGGSSVTWVEVMEGLSEHGPVVAVDLPGFGRTPIADDDPLTMHGYVAFVLDVADALGWERFTLHGNSMGGLVGTLLAADDPDRVDRLVLVSPALPPRSPLGFLRPSRATIDGMLPVAVSSLTALALGAVGLAGPGLDARRNRALLKLIFPDPDGVDRAVLALMAADFAEDIEGVDRRRALLAATCSVSSLWADPRQTWRAIRGIQSPTLLLGGTKDALVPAKVLRSVLAARPDWEGHVIDDRRHALMLEDPETYLRLFDGWGAGAAAA
ncbi:alpha/beta fold hydrolase [Nocardioides bizhenqiangii]|uniref:Alpha/beta hydrolase n=1 Tax=Nocardioides bizhenqiangii TaxID=3095076 RepID=A0ABZ0ZNN5_9ACTN|nr:alpha/beta hydrolase [Nocardioides sp. HM61]WQQ25933.1 alpha/beta hydrolase [Nocardioides sp. HM61]